MNKLEIIIIVTVIAVMVTAYNSNLSFGTSCPDMYSALINDCPDENAIEALLEKE